jgi:sugar O-acyltransferase (sialic acid O-acetyltransferase NeuD family)
MLLTCASMFTDPADLVVFGCGSQALYVVDARAAAGLPPPVALVDLESGNMIGRTVAGIPVRFTRTEALAAFDPETNVALVAHGDNRLKLEVADALAAHGARFVSAVHPRAGISLLAKIAPGCILCPGCEILPNGEIEEHAIVHAGATIEHDCRIGRGANIAPGATLAGRVTVGEGAYVFTAAAIAPKVRIGAWATIGAGAVIRHDVAPGAVVVGNPQRVLR